MCLFRQVQVRNELSLKPCQSEEEITCQDELLVLFLTAIVQLKWQTESFVCLVLRGTHNVVMNPTC